MEWNPNRKRKAGSRHRIWETGIARSWKPEDYASDEQMNLVFDLLMQAKEVEQTVLVDAVHDALPHLKRGTAAAIVSASLLYLLDAGFVEVAHEGSPAVWRIVP